MGIIGLNQPTDITWERICVSDDMMDIEVCDDDLPPKWQSSLALFKYEPGEDYQVYPGRKLTYLKVAATLTGYQPKDAEIEGTIDWDQLDVETEEDFEEMLEEYSECTGALLQVTVGGDDDVDEAELPYVMDYQPKRRVLYDMVSETAEQASRSLESLNVRKAAGTTESLEVLDIDMGGSEAVSGNYGANVAGVGGVEAGGSYATSHQQQVGTKQLAGEEESRVQTADRSRERREGYSHTTQLSQVHHLLDSYHLGTNRALFFVLPRPYTKRPATPTGFVRGPRGIDGVQEFFIVVNSPADQEELCVSVRLDTGHYRALQHATVAKKDHVPSSVEVDGAPPSKTDPNAIKRGYSKVSISAFGFGTGHAFYRVYERTYEDEDEFVPAVEGFEGYRIDTSRNGGYSVVEGVGDYDVEVDDDGQWIRYGCRATSRKDYYWGAWSGSEWGDGVEWPDLAIDDDTEKPRNARRGRAKLTIEVHLVSEDEVVDLPPTKSLLLTTRGLCCCPGRETDYGDGYVVDVVDLPDYTKEVDPDVIEELPWSGRFDVGTSGIESDDEPRLRRPPAESGLMTPAEANQLGGEATKRALLRSSTSRRRKETTPASAVETEYVAESALDVALRSKSRQRLAVDVSTVAPELADVAASYYGVEELPEPIAVRDVARIPTDDLANRTGYDAPTINRLKFEAIAAAVARPVEEADDVDDATFLALGELDSGDRPAAVRSRPTKEHESDEVAALRDELAELAERLDQFDDAADETVEDIEDDIEELLDRVAGLERDDERAERLQKRIEDLRETAADRSADEE